MMGPGRALWIGLALLGVSACSQQARLADSSAAARPTQAHAHFAPPPEGRSHWDPQLSVYVLEHSPDLYYRQRTYYRWSHGWSWSTQAAGPWQGCDSSFVPAGLSRRYQQ